MTDRPESRFPVPTTRDLPDDVRDQILAALFALSNRMANLTGMRPNGEFYSMGREPR